MRLTELDVLKKHSDIKHITKHYTKKLPKEISVFNIWAHDINTVFRWTEASKN